MRQASSPCLSTTAAITAVSILFLLIASSCDHVRIEAFSIIPSPKLSSPVYSHSSSLFLASRASSNNLYSCTSTRSGLTTDAAAAKSKVSLSRRRHHLTILKGSSKEQEGGDFHNSQERDDHDDCNHYKKEKEEQQQPPQLVTREMLLRDMLSGPEDEENTTYAMDGDEQHLASTSSSSAAAAAASAKVKRKKKNGSSSQYRTLDNRDSLPFLVRVATPDPYTSNEQMKKEAKLNTERAKKKLKKNGASAAGIGKMRHNLVGMDGKDSISSSIYARADDGSMHKIIGEFALDKSTNCGDIIEVGDGTQYQVQKARCQYKYVGGKRFVMTRKILEVKEIKRILIEKEVQSLFEKELSDVDTKSEGGLGGGPGDGRFLE
jgi:hypothetical protein